MPEMKQTSIDTVAMEMEEKSRSSSESSDDEGEAMPREPTITRTITQTVKRHVPGSSDESEDNEEKGNVDEKEEVGKVRTFVGKKSI